MKLWYRTGDISLLRDLSASSVVCLDTETTGLDPNVDEVLQIALLRGDGTTIMNRYVRPVTATSWDCAQRVHCISPSDVRRCPPFSAFVDEIGRAIEAAELVVGYNVPFDLSFLRVGGVAAKPAETFDVMREFAPVMGRWDALRKRYVWPSLSYCAAQCGYRFVAHDALEDARATLHCFWTMLGRSQAGGRGGRGGTYLDIVRRHAGSGARAQGESGDGDTGCSEAQRMRSRDE